MKRRSGPQRQLSRPRCAFCGGPIPEDARSDALTCGKKCGQAGYRLRKQSAAGVALAGPLTSAYADPAYPGRARRYYGMPEVDHRELIARLEQITPAGWALSTSEDALRWLLPLCPPARLRLHWSRAPARNGRHRASVGCSLQFGLRS